MAAQKKSLAQMDLNEIWQDPKGRMIVLITLGVVVLGIIIGVVVTNLPPPQTAAGGQSNVFTDPTAGPGGGMPGGPAGMAPDPGGRLPGAGGAGTDFGAMGPGGGMDATGGFAGGFGGASGGAAPVADIDDQKDPGVPTRANPFRENSDLAAVVKSVPERTPDIPAPPGLYDEIKPQKPIVTETGDELEGPPIPAMRVSGIIEGQQVAAMLHIGSAYITAIPGQEIPKDNPTYRVESIEKEKVVLTRRWELGNRKGIQRIEVPLAADPSQQLGGIGGFPGGPGMLGGGSGGFPGGPGSGGGFGGPRGAPVGG